MAIQVIKPHVLVVEGKDEELFFEALIRYMRLQHVQVLSIGGKTNLRANLKALALSPGFANVVSLGIIRDADQDPLGALQSVQDALRAASLPAPVGVLSPAGDKPKVMIMIMPAENTPGALEDLCLQSVTQDPAMLCVGVYFQCLQKQGLPMPSNLPKARVQAFLASRQEAGKRLGEAAQAGYLPWDDKAFEPVRNFLQQLGS